MAPSWQDQCRKEQRSVNATLRHGELLHASPLPFSWVAWHGDRRPRIEGDLRLPDQPLQGVMVGSPVGDPLDLPDLGAGKGAGGQHVHLGA